MQSERKDYLRKFIMGLKNLVHVLQMQLKTKEFKKMMWKKFNLLNWYVYFYVNVMVSVFSEPDHLNKHAKFKLSSNL